MKKIIKRVLAMLFGNKFSFIIYYHFLKKIKKDYIIAVTYHDTPITSSISLQSHFEFFNKYFSNCSKLKLEKFLKNGEWEDEKPGIIISFDDGLLTNYKVAKPLLDKFNFTGWFMIPAKVMDIKKDQQYQFAKKAKILEYIPNNKKRLFMSKKEVEILNKEKHEIVNHTYSHPRLSEELNDDRLELEINFSKTVLENIISKKVNSFAWVGGEEYAFSKNAFRKIRETEYEFVFSTNCRNIYSSENQMCLDRFHLDANYKLFEVCLSISWVYVLLYWRKRKRIIDLLFN